MHASDDKPFPLAPTKRSPQPRRTVSKKDFSLPKPYRRQLFSEEPERLTRLQTAMLTLGALLVAAVLAVLALLAQESDHSPDGKVIVAAARLETVDSVEAQLASLPPPAAPAEPPVPPALQHEARTAGMLPTQTPATRMHPATKPKAKAKARQPTRLAGAPKKPALHGRALAALLEREKKIRPAPMKPAPREPTLTIPAPDPDVALIAAILLLTPAPLPASAPAVAMELAGRAQGTCMPVTPKDHGCAELHKLKP
ncbi:hypothetical protein [Massilia sp. TWP1-3-3]|uniref:hypothetical protein n=1 Tax=Massilia sp. TWP1-3-3 TaxID=2804573 RepID=UPI003CEBC642